MTEEAEQLIEKFDELVRQALTLAQEGRIKEANACWHTSIVPTFAALWHLTNNPEVSAESQKIGVSH